MKKRKKVASFATGKKKAASSQSQVHMISSGLKAKKAPTGCSSCGKKRIK